MQSIELLHRFGTTLKATPTTSNHLFSTEFPISLANALFKTFDLTTVKVEIALTFFQVKITEYPPLPDHICFRIKEIKPIYCNNENDNTIIRLPFTLARDRISTLSTYTPLFYELNPAHLISSLTFEITDSKGKPLSGLLKETLYFRTKIQLQKRDTTMSSFYWSCTREGNTNFFEESYNTNFKCQVPFGQKIMEGEWEVALTEVVYNNPLITLDPYITILRYKKGEGTQSDSIKIPTWLLHQKNIKSLLLGINKELNKKGFGHLTVTAANDLRITFNVSPEFSDNADDYFRITMEKELGMIFGFRQGIKAIILTLKSGEDFICREEFNVFRVIPTNLLFCSDLVSPSLCQKPYENVLCSLVLNFFDHMRSQHYIPNILLYKPVTSGFMSSCRFWLVDIDGKPFKWANKEDVFVSLHFRRREQLFFPYGQK